MAWGWQTAFAHSVGSSEALQVGEYKHPAPASPQLYLWTSHLDAADVQDAQTAHLEMIQSWQLFLCLLGHRSDELGGEIMLESTFLVLERTQAMGAYT